MHPIIHKWFTFSKKDHPSVMFSYKNLQSLICDTIMHITIYLFNESQLKTFEINTR